MYYMPGIDGSGLAAYRQFPRLTRAFDLRCLIIPRTDRSSFEELVDTVAVSSRARGKAMHSSMQLPMQGRGSPKLHSQTR
jgi:hypothetical protein